MSRSRLRYIFRHLHFVGAAQEDAVWIDVKEIDTEDEDIVNLKFSIFQGGKSQPMSTMSTNKIWKTQLTPLEIYPTYSLKK